MTGDLNPAIMGAIEKKIVEAMLRLTEVHRILNYLKAQHGFEVVPLEKLVPIGADDGKDREEEEPACPT